MLKIQRVKRTNLYDVFLGQGWNNHTRVTVKDKHVHIIKGNPLTKIQFVEIAKTVNS
jgi:hypothetical protein